MELDEKVYADVLARESASITGLDLAINALKKVEEGLEKFAKAINDLAAAVSAREDKSEFTIRPGDKIRIEIHDVDIMSDFILLEVDAISEDGNEIQFSDKDFGTHVMMNRVILNDE